MDHGRRILLQGAAGAAAGFCFTPVPWRLLGDVAIRTQNSPWAAPLPRGEITLKATHCTLCPGGCEARVRCAGGMPFGVQPGSEALCPAAFAAHQFAFHPQRLRTVMHQGSGATLEAAVAAVKQRIESGAGTVAVLDLAPGRTASRLHRHHLGSIRNGIYVEAPAIEGATAAAISRLMKKPARLALDLEHTRTILSLGTPLMEGWAPPRALFQRAEALRIIQVEAERSHTADVANEWLALRAGSELAFLLGVAGVLFPEDAELPRLTLDEAARRTGLAADQIRNAAQELSAKPAAILADRDPANGPHSAAVEALAAALNVKLGAVGTAGGFVAALETPAPKDWTSTETTRLASLDDHSIGVLILDEPLPGSALDWNQVERKLRQDALIVGCTWTRTGAARRASWLIPVPVYLESWQDSAAGVHTGDARFQMSAAFMKAPPAAIEAAEFLARLAGDETTYAQRLEQRAAAICEAGSGWLSKPGSDERVEIKSLKAADFWTALQEGGRWHSSRPPDMKMEIAGLQVAGIDGGTSAGNPALRVPGWRPAASSPLLAKMWQDSDLKKSPGATLAEGGVRS